MREVPEALFLQMRQEISIFRFLSEEAARDLRRFFRLLEVSKGETLWRQGDPCRYVGFITSGRLQITKNTDFAGREVIVGVYSMGSIVGELCILDDHPRAVTAVALEDTVLAVLTRENFENLLDEHPRLGVLFLKGMYLRVAIRLRKSFDRLADIF